MTTTTHDAIATRAYFVWEDEGRPHGRDEHHWFSAEAIELQDSAEVQPPVMAAEVASIVTSELAKKAAPARKTAAPKRTAAAKVATPKAPAETVVAAAALSKTPRATRTLAKSARSTH